MVKVRPALKSASWFALSFACGGLAFGVQFFHFLLPDWSQAFFGASLYNAMAACFVIALILRADRKPPKLTILAVAAGVALTISICAIGNVHILVQVCLAQLTAGGLLLTALIYAHRRREGITDKAVLGISAAIMGLLFAQPLIVVYMLSLPGTNLEADISTLFLRIGALTTTASVVMATLLVREYVLLIIKELKEIAAQDELTKVFNRRGFEEAIHGATKKANKQGLKMSFIVLDIDHFKQVNDTYGHGFGDDVLAALGKLLNAHKAKQRLAARMGGEEFVFAVPVRCLDEARMVAELIKERWRRCRHFYNGDEIRCTASFGVALHTEGETLAATLERADRALYRSKKLGRDKVQTELDLKAPDFEGDRPKEEDGKSAIVPFIAASK